MSDLKLWFAYEKQTEAGTIRRSVWLVRRSSVCFLSRWVMYDGVLGPL